MTPELAITLTIIAGLALLMWHRLGDRTEDHEVQTAAEAAREKRIRNQRLAMLRDAYRLAKQELGEEPTAEQILMTRDAMWEKKVMEDGKTR